MGKSLQQTLYIDNMVCARCISAVRELLGRLGWRVVRVKLGEAIAIAPGDVGARSRLAQSLQALGLPFRMDRHPITGRIKGVIIEYVYDNASGDGTPLSVIISRETGQSYGHLSRSFTAAEGRTIEAFFLAQRMERAKRLLHSTTEPVSEIGRRLKYRSPGHFSSAFRPLFVGRWAVLPAFSVKAIRIPPGGWMNCRQNTQNSKNQHNITKHAPLFLPFQIQ